MQMISGTALPATSETEGLEDAVEAREPCVVCFGPPPGGGFHAGDLGVVARVEIIAGLVEHLLGRAV